MKAGELEPPKLSTKGAAIIGVAIWLTLFTYLFLYGFLGDMYVTMVTDLVKELNGVPLLIMQTLFVLVGFGLVVTPGPHAKWTGMTMGLFVVVFNFVISPLIQEIWVKAFIYSIDTSATSDPGALAPTSPDFFNRTFSIDATLTYTTLRNTNHCSTAFLVGMTAFAGRISFVAVPPLLIIFNILYFLNFYGNIRVSYDATSKDFSLRYMDDYGTYLVYLFGSVFGMVVARFCKQS